MNSKTWSPLYQFLATVATAVLTLVALVTTGIFAREVYPEKVVPVFDLAAQTLEDLGNLTFAIRIPSLSLPKVSLEKPKVERPEVNLTLPKVSLPFVNLTYPELDLSSYLQKTDLIDAYTLQGYSPSDFALQTDLNAYLLKDAEIDADTFQGHFFTEFALKTDLAGLTGTTQTGTTTTTAVDLSSYLKTTGQAADSAKLGGQLPSYYTNASNLSSGTVPSARLFLTDSDIPDTITASNYLLLSGGTVTGRLNIEGTATFGTSTLTIDSSGNLSTSGTITISNTGASALKISGGITAGSGEVGIIDTSGKIPALSSTYFANLSGANLISLNASQLSSGVLPSARISGSYTGISGVGSLTSGTWQANEIADAYIANNITASNYLPLSGGTLTGALTVSGVSGLTDADIPNTITASNYLPLAGGTLAGELVFYNVSSSTSTTEGAVYYDTDDDNLYLYTTAGWVDLTQQDTDTSLTEAQVEAMIFDADNTGTLSSGTLALDSLSFTGTLADAYIPNDITVNYAADAGTLDTIASTSFLRSDTSDSYTLGALTFSAGTTLDVSSATLTLAAGQIDESKVSGEIEAVTAGSGLTGGGTADSITLNVGAGDGISVSADAIAVDATVLRTTTSFGGDVSGTYDAISLGADTVGAAELSSSAIQVGDIEAGDLPSDGYASTYVNVSGDTMTGELVFYNAASSLSTTEGAVYYDTDDDNLYLYTTAGWVDLTQQDTNTTYSAGDGLNLTGTTFSLDATVLRTTTTFGGDVSGTYNALELGANSVGATELSSTAIVLGDIEAGDLPSDGYASTYVNVSGDTMTGELVFYNAASSLSTTEGTVYYDTDDDNLYLYTTAGWIDLTQQDTDTTLTEAQVEAMIFDADNTGTLSSGTLALNSLSFTGILADAYIPNDITVNFAADAGTLDTIDSTSFLRSDTSDSYTSGILTFSAGTTLDVSSATLTLAINQIDESKISGEIEAVTAGSGLTGGGTADLVTLNVGAGDGILVGADTVAVDSTVLRTTTSFGGDVSGAYDAIELGANSVGASELSSSAIVPGDIEAGDLPTDGYASTYVNVSGDTMTGELVFYNAASSLSTTEGTVYYDTDDDNLYVYTTAGWVDLTQQDTDTTLTEAQVEAMIFDADNTGTLSSGTLALNSLSFTGTLADSYVANDITASNYLPLAGGTLTGILTVNGVSGLTDADIPNGITIDATGTVADGALSSNVALLDTAQTFSANKTFADGTLLTIDRLSDGIASLQNGILGGLQQLATNEATIGTQITTPLIYVGASQQSRIQYDVGDGTIQLGLPDYSVVDSHYPALIIAETSDVGSSMPGLTQTPTDPTLYLFGAAATNYLALYHDDTNATITTSTGSLILDAASSSIYLAAGDDLLATDGNTNIGSAGTRINTIYADSVNGLSLIGTVVTGNTSSDTWTINSDNTTADTEDAHMAFERGTVTPNALISWDSASDKFSLNAPLELTSGIGTANLTLAGDLTVSGGDITVGSSAALSDSAGTLTLSNVDAIDATTETTIETAIDTLSNLTSASSLATVGTLSSGTLALDSLSYTGTLDDANVDNDITIASTSSGSWTLGAGESFQISESGVTATANLVTLTLDETGQASSAYDTLVVSRVNPTSGGYAFYVSTGNALFGGTTYFGSTSNYIDSSGNLVTTGTSVTASSATISGNLFSGSGASLTNLSASSISSGTLGTGYFSAYSDLVAESKIGTGATQVAAGDHTHSDYEAKGTKITRLFPEYPGAVLAADGTNNTGSMTSDKEAHGNYKYNYYEWNSAEASLQDYDIYVKWQVPDNFNGFPTATDDALIVDIATETTLNTQNKVDVYLYEDGSATAATSDLANVSSVAADWHTDQEGNAVIAFDESDTILSGLSAGDVLVIRIVLYSLSNNYARVGAITINWKSN